jgi:hypothetical protein
MRNDYTIPGAYPDIDSTVLINRGALPTRWQPPASCLDHTTLGEIRTATDVDISGNAQTQTAYYVGVKSGGIPDPACVPPAKTTPPVSSVRTSCYTYRYASSTDCTESTVMPAAFYSPGICPEGYSAGLDFYGTSMFFPLFLLHNVFAGC